MNSTTDRENLINAGIRAVALVQERLYIVDSLLWGDCVFDGVDAVQTPFAWEEVFHDPHIIFVRGRSQESMLQAAGRALPRWILP